jgi:hypothetical protein
VALQADRAALAAFQARMGSDAPDMVVPGRRLLLESHLHKQCRKAGLFSALCCLFVDCCVALFVV